MDRRDSAGSCSIFCRFRLESSAMTMFGGRCSRSSAISGCSIHSVTVLGSAWRHMNGGVHITQRCRRCRVRRSTSKRCREEEKPGVQQEQNRKGSRPHTDGLGTNNMRAPRGDKRERVPCGRLERGRSWSGGGRLWPCSTCNRISLPISARDNCFPVGYMEPPNGWMAGAISTKLSTE